MPKLNNKDFTVEELERMLYLVSNLLSVDKLKSPITGELPQKTIREQVQPVFDELKELVKGSQFTNFGDGERKPNPIPWNFKFEMLITPESQENANTIINAMRSSEVNENIKKRFNAIVREEVNWYIDRVKYFLVKGDTNVLE